MQRRHFSVRECVENLQIVVPFVATADNMADFFTKPLGPKQFFPLRNRIMNFSGCARGCTCGSRGYYGGVRF